MNKLELLEKIIKDIVDLNFGDAKKGLHELIERKLVTKDCERLNLSYASTAFGDMNYGAAFDYLQRIMLKTDSKDTEKIENKDLAPFVAGENAGKDAGDEAGKNAGDEAGSGDLLAAYGGKTPDSDTGKNNGAGDKDNK